MAETVLRNVWTCKHTVRECLLYIFIFFTNNEGIEFNKMNLQISTLRNQTLQLKSLGILSCCNYFSSS